MFIKPPHKQEIFFDNGSMRVVDRVVKIEQGNWFHLMSEDGTEFITNPHRILFIRVSKPLPSPTEGGMAKPLPRPRKARKE